MHCIIDIIMIHAFEKLLGTVYNTSAQDRIFLTTEAAHTSVFGMSAVVDSHSTMSTLRQSEFTASALYIIQ